MYIVLWSLDSHFHLWWNIVQFWTIFVLTFVESVNNIANRIVFISTATCKNKRRNSPLTPVLTKGLSFAYSHCPMSQTRSTHVAIPEASLCLLGKITVKSTPWGKAFLRNHPCFAASALKEAKMALYLWMAPWTHQCTEKRDCFMSVDGEEEALLKLFSRAEPWLCSWPYSNPGHWHSTCGYGWLRNRPQREVTEGTGSDMVPPEW